MFAFLASVLKLHGQCLEGVKDDLTDACPVHLV